MKIAFQTNGRINGTGKNSLEYNLMVKSPNCILGGLLDQGIDEIYHFNSDDVWSSDGKTPLADVTHLKISEPNPHEVSQNQFIYGLEYELIGRDTIPLGELDFLLTRSITHLGNPHLEELYGNLGNKPVMINKIQGHILTKDKFSIPNLFENPNYFRIPETFLAYDLESMIENINKIKGEKVVIKSRWGSKGEEVELIDKNHDDVQERAEVLYNDFGECVVQEYITSVSEIGDIRVVFFDGEIIGTHGRIGAEGFWRTTLSRGGKIIPFELNDTQIKACNEIIGAYPHVMFNGIDLTCDEIPYFIEANSFPGSLTALNRIYGQGQERPIIDFILKQ